MEGSEPALVPEWLRCSASVTGVSSAPHHVPSSSLHPEHSSSTRSCRSFRSISDKDSPRSAFLDRSSSSNSRRSSSSNGSTKHPYSSFTRSQRDRNRDRERERSVGGGHWDHDDSDTLDSILANRTQKNTLRRSQSLVSRNPVEMLPRRIEDTRNAISSGGRNLVGTQKSVFEKDFPSLGTEGKQGHIVRVPSPGLTSNVQSLPIGSSPMLGGEKWTSALAEVPAMVGLNGMTNSSVPQSTVSSPVSSASSAMAGFNMAEALSQAPPRARATPQVDDKTQRLEELALKQSRQLIPMVPNSLDKSKQLKTTVRTAELNLMPKGLQQQAYVSQHVNQSRGGQVKSDTTNTSHLGKFLVLKPTRENGVASAKDAFSPTNNASGQVSNGQVPVAQPTPAALPSVNAKVSITENKIAAISLNSRANAEKKTSLSQAQSRSDFFNLVRKKSSNSTSNVLSNSSPAASSPKLEKSGEVMKKLDSFPASPCISENDSHLACNGDVHSTPDKANISQDDEDKNLYLNGVVYPDEEEAAFLRSLGWEENAGEDECLTEEEINAFYQEYMKSRPSLKVLGGTRPKLLSSNLRASNKSISSSESSSSGSR